MARTDSPDPAAQLASSSVHRRLREQILSGVLAPGDPIPSERDLAEEIGVNRHAVREALKRLQQAGLVRIAQGGATRVRDWHDTAGLELMLDLVEHGAEPPAELIRSALEMRASIGIDAARRCTDRADADTRAVVSELAEVVAAAVEQERGAGVVESYVSLWQGIVGGSGNLAYRLGLNSLNSALDAYPEFGELLVPRDAAVVRQLGKAIGAGNGEAAAEAAKRLLEADIDLAA